MQNLFTASVRDSTTGGTGEIDVIENGFNELWGFKSPSQNVIANCELRIVLTIADIAFQTGFSSQSHFNQ
jgi:AraC-like DNA-binding protein